ncbi:molecular chaperone [Colwellia psychrerythraea]|uniref:Heat shock protein 70 n=1 Tax=Colwellia psychrerythraea TaxID=28229 RepID=A0A099KKA5_COLPS|nr:molecular chaperone [Colwellia psychrerythraea]KGJ90856.1 Heat shock protein 70 [Colwellia psychrerythraea]
MMIGFDYGTSNCSVANMRNGQPHIIPLLGNTLDGGSYIASNLYAPSRDVIANWLSQQLATDQQANYLVERKNQIQKGQAALRELKFDGISSELLFGKTALQQYLEDPEEGYYIKSPKSFLGSSGLAPTQIQFFEDIVACMMSNVKKLTEQVLQKEVTQTVIGRPINFQGLHGEESNRQAISVLTNAAKRVGFKDVEFQYEPVAAGFEFEASLTKETRVLVVDIGGGTSDCSMLLMSPDFSNNDNRNDHLLAHTGVRIAGNDFDIQLALQGIMPSLGMNSLLKTGKPMPTASFRQALAINNINEQTEFYSAKNRRDMELLSRDAQESELVSRLLTVHDHKLSYQLVNGAEQAKIRLSEHNEQTICLNDISDSLSVTVSRETLKIANARTLDNIARLMTTAVAEAQCQPEVIFVTGGTAKSPILSEFLQQQMPGIPLIVGDHFGSVTSGLARWAEKIYR